MTSSALRSRPPIADRRQAILRFGVGTLIYPAVTALGLLSPVVMLILLIAVSLYYVLDQTPVLDHQSQGATDDG